MSSNESTGGATIVQGARKSFPGADRPALDRASRDPVPRRGRRRSDSPRGHGVGDRNTEGPRTLEDGYLHLHERNQVVGIQLLCPVMVVLLGAAIAGTNGDSIVVFADMLTAVAADHAVLFVLLSIRAYRRLS
ncbi:hypothetical protein [Nocardia sp. NPDC057227]|uniref:hypothetical protein n=1 Tax=Nocardia sp. NPDC057227 TaxID=3346056 RepID=UPI00363CBDE7